MERDNKRFVFITYLRTLATLCIFNCHLLFIANQYELSVWANVGVPLFLVISAYLFSGREYKKKDIIGFFKKRLTSIFVPYEIYVICVIIVLIIVRNPPKLKAVVMYGLGLSAFSNVALLGLGHLWYITIIFICYLITPIVYKLNTIPKGYRLLLPLTAAQVVVFFVFGYPSYGVHIGSYICCFTFFQNNRRILSKKHLKVLWISAFVFSLFRIFFDRVFSAMGGTIFYYYDAVFQPVARLALALGLFSLFYFFSEHFEWQNNEHSIIVKRIIGAFSSISFEFYLVHQFIELSVWKYLPVMKCGKVVGALLFASISFGFSLLNAVVLRFIEKRVIVFANRVRSITRNKRNGL